MSRSARLIRTIPALKQAVRRFKGAGRRIGFVPTLGALHDGHASLIRKAAAENDRVVVSVFVNPIQFDDPKDLRAYPRQLRQDAIRAVGAGADLVFAPSAAAMQPTGFQTGVEVSSLSRLWEGQFRPGHLRGVATVVTQLFHLVEPDTAYFGFKDAQQSRVVAQLIQDLHFPVRLRVLPTVREPDGLAVSSRNSRLSPVGRKRAAELFAALQETKRLIQSSKERRSNALLSGLRRRLRSVPGLRIDYVAAVDPRTLQPLSHLRGTVWLLAAVRIEGVRLLDGCSVRA